MGDWGQAFDGVGFMMSQNVPFPPGGVGLDRGLYLQTLSLPRAKMFDAVWARLGAKGDFVLT
jgi:hypothetical protein